MNAIVTDGGKTEAYRGAEDLIGRGIYPVPFDLKTKGPNRKSWPSLRLTTSDLPREFRRPCNVGMLLIDSLVDIDLDNPIAAELAHEHLPPTNAKFGRASKRRSHWLYRTNKPMEFFKIECKDVRSDDSHEKTIVEFRTGYGIQTMAPGSVHPSGELVEWDDDGEIPVVDGDDLAARVRALGEATIRQLGLLPADGIPADREPDLSAFKLPDFSAGDKPGADFNRRGNVREVLRRNGWTFTHRSGENEHWRRPGKSDGTSATIKDAVFYCFTSSTAIPGDKAHSPFAVLAHLEHGGDFSAAAKQLAAEGYGDALLSRAVEYVPPAEERKQTAEPAKTFADFFNVPGFVNELKDFTLDTAPYPNEALAFCGALAMLSFLTGRKVRDVGGLRTNLYLLGLAQSGSGKDRPRQVNTEILARTNMLPHLGESFASREGLEDALLDTPSMLFQTDEFDTLLASMSEKESRFELLMGSLLKLYTSAGTIFPMRRKAGQPAQHINQPHLVLFGTAIPSHYYRALTERMLTNGLFARMLVVDAGSRGKGQDVGPPEIPDRILDSAVAWRDSFVGLGNLAVTNPTPRPVRATDEAEGILANLRRRAEIEWDKAQGSDSASGCAVWARTAEHGRKLALLYACSENHTAPEIGIAAATWGAEVAFQQTTQMLEHATAGVSANGFDAVCQNILKKLGHAPHRRMKHSDLLKASRLEASQFVKVMTTLRECGDVKFLVQPTGGREGVVYEATP